ncbi:cupin [Seiridium cupressi]
MTSCSLLVFKEGKSFEPTRPGLRSGPSSNVPRKTGVMLKDTGERDEYGMEPVSNIFSSSPQRGSARKSNGNGPDATSTSDAEQDMDIDEASTLGPATVSRMRRDRVSLPKARSPGKTFLNSPARHNPHIGRTSSPTRRSVIEEDEHVSPSRSAKRRLDFSKDPKMKPATNGHSQTNGSSKLANAASQAEKELFQPPKHSRVNGYTHDDSDEQLDARRSKGKAPVYDDDDEEEEEEPMDFLNTGGDDLDLPEVDDESVEEEHEEPQDAGEEDEEEEEPAPIETAQPKKRGRKPKAISPPVEEPPGPVSEPESEPGSGSESEPEIQEKHEEPAKKKRGRPGKRPSTEEVEPAKPAKRPRGRPSLNKDKISPNQAETSATAVARGSGKQKTGPKPKENTSESSKEAPAKAKPGRRRKSSAVGAESPPVPSRPPMPRSRGLVSQRRDKFEVKTTRSGRVSTKPLEFWRGERYDYDEEEDEVIQDKQGRRIKIGPKIKGVVRVEYDGDEDKPKRRRGRPAAGRPKRRVSDVEEDEEREEWEDDPGRVIGDCIYWQPDYEFNPPQDEDQVEVAEEELAISEGAIQMKDIKDATFRFAKTLTLPFFGSGIVDLPPHSEKRIKNARKMQMAFFVHYGNVEVTVSSTSFRITKGGTWFVPRGNHYSIVNDTDKPARLFFCQGCEMPAQVAESQEM